MTAVLMSSDTNGNLRRAYRQYVRTQRRTPSGRLYDSLTMVEWDGAVCPYTAQLTRDGSRALRGLCLCGGGARQRTTTHEEAL
jgi:hypothetical protein